MKGGEFMRKKEKVTSIVMTNPVIEGLADGCNVVGSIVGIVEGKSDGVDVIKMELDSTLHWSL